MQFIKQIYHQSNHNKIIQNSFNHNLKIKQNKFIFDFQFSICPPLQFSCVFKPKVQQYIILNMQYDSICFQDQCRLSHKQLFCSRDSDSLHHFDQKHTVELIHYGSNFFRNFNTQPIKFHSSREQTHAQLQKQYLRHIELIEAMKQAMTQKFQQCQKKIEEIYELQSKEVGLDVCEPHLKSETSKTQLCLTIINLRKSHPSTNIKDYIENMPDTCISDYSTTMNSMIESLLSNKQIVLSKLPQKVRLLTIKEQNPIINQHSRLLQKGLNIAAIYNQNVNFEPKLSLHKQFYKQFQLTKQIQSQKEESLIKMTQLFCTSKLNSTYKEINQTIINKLNNRNWYHIYLVIIIRKVFLHIQEWISKQFGFKKMKSNDRERICTYLKDYQTWMNQSEINVLMRCACFFTQFDKNIKINQYEVYVIYVSIVIQLIKKMQEKDLELTYNITPRNLKKEIIYLCMHYGDFYKIRQIMIARYQSLKKHTELLKLAQKGIMIDTQNELNKTQGVQNGKFWRILNQETDYSGQSWKKIVQKYAEYQIYNKVDKTWKEDLLNIMSVIVSELHIEVNEEKQMQAEERLQSIEQTFKKIKGQIDFKSNNKSDSNIHMKDQDQRIENLQIEKVVKIEQNSDSNSGWSQYYELDSQQKDD